MDANRIKAIRDLVAQASTTSIKALVDEFIAYCESSELSQTTVNTRRSHLKNFIEFLSEVKLDDIELLSNQLLEQYFIYFRESHSRSTTNTSRRIIRAYLTWLTDYKELSIRANPTGIKITKIHSKKPKAIDINKIRWVIENCKSEQDKLIIATFIETGVRISELTGLKVEDLKLDEISVTGKGLKDRTIPITPGLYKALRGYTAHRSPEDHIFINCSVKGGSMGKPITQKTVWRRIKAEFARHGMDMHPHQLRHSFAMLLLKSGCDIVTIKDLLGHEDINTTMIYLKLTDDHRKNEYMKHMGSGFMA